MIEPQKKYKKRVDLYSQRAKTYERNAGKAGNYKLLEFLCGIAAAIILYILDFYILMIAELLIFIVGFIILSRVQNRLLDRKKYANSMLQINIMCLKRVNGEWKQFEDSGEEFVDPEHSYSNDLDIFGKNSLFQMINMTSTYSGRQKLSELLLSPLKSREEIEIRQNAVMELSGKLLFRQRLLANALQANNILLLNDKDITDKKHVSLLSTINKLDDIYKWADEENKLYRSKWFVAFITILPAVTILSLILSVFKILPLLIPIAGYATQFLILAYKANYRSRSFELVEKYKNNLNIYAKLLMQFEKESFDSVYINNLKQKLENKKGKPAHIQLNKLSKIWELIANRYNLFHSIINIATLWDYHCLVKLERWKMESGTNIKSWFDSIGEVEALCSISTICHDNPEYIMPQICDVGLGINALELGHPLLVGERKSNSITINNEYPILLITGSNMSGKSTFLRTIGISLIMAYIGAPVCAQKFSCPIMTVCACMKTSDNLGQNVSSFYAELLRVKMIVQRVESEEKVFFMLDEIFKGTNSADRHAGAEILIKQLLKKGAWGLVSTHDLELAQMEEQSQGKIRNYHFKEYYKDNEIYFDYKIRKGVSNTRNAIFLMKMAGVSVDDA